MLSRSIFISAAYTCRCRVLLTAIHIRLYRYTHDIKRIALCLTGILIQSMFTNAQEIGPHENAVGVYALSMSSTTGQWGGIPTRGNVTNQLVEATEKAWLLYPQHKGVVMATSPAEGRMVAHVFPQWRALSHFIYFIA